MSNVLGRVTLDMNEARGPDAQHRIAVEAGWFEQGVTVRFPLPRTLSCARCKGGGCDTCERSGAISTRERSDEPEQVEVTLPRKQIEPGTSVLLRIPLRGGVSENPNLPRGHLLLSIRAQSEPDASVTRVPDTVPPGPSTAAPNWRWPALALLLIVALLLALALR